MAKIILSAFADEHSDALVDQLAALNSYGIEYLEPRFVDGKSIADLTPDEVAAMKAALDRHGVRISSIGSPIGKIKLDGDLEGHFAMARRVFETANTLGTKYVRMFSFYPADGKCITDCRDEVIAGLTRLLDLADEYGVILCHENEANIYGERAEKCLDLLEHFGGRLKCVFDMGNFVFCNLDPIEAYKLLKPYIQYFHIKDACYEGAIVPPGKGDAKIGEILHDFADGAECDVIATLEPHLETFSGLRHLIGRKFENPYKFETKEAAFDEAVKLIKEIII